MLQIEIQAFRAWPASCYTVIMEHDFDTQQQAEPKRIWTGAWGTAPWNDVGSEERGLRRAWFHHAAHKAVRARSNGPEQMQKYLQEAASNPEDALMALRAGAFMAPESPSHALVLNQALEGGLADGSNPDLWAEGWMLGKFVSSLLHSQAQAEQRQLAKTLVRRWPWALVQAGRMADAPWKHPLYSLVRGGQRDLAMELSARIPTDDWIATDTGGRNNRSWIRVGGWNGDDAAWPLHLLNVAPALMQIDRESGMGPLELAARNHKPAMLEALWQHGLRPDPGQSFGLSLAHWAAFGVSEEEWNPKTNSATPLTDDEVSQRIDGLQFTLEKLVALGDDISAPVLKVDTTGLRRARGMPKPKDTPMGYLAGRKFRVATMTQIERIQLEIATPAAPSKGPSRGTRRL